MLHHLWKVLLLTVMPSLVTSGPLDNFDNSDLQNFNLSNLSPLLNPPTFTELAGFYGYTAVSYDVITDDGYILTMFRIRGTRPALPVLLFHGLTDSADTWMVRGEASLAAALADAGYDVWLGNARGNKYSRRHRTLDPDVDADFWNFSFDEHGLSDLPATIDVVLNETGAPRLNMIGHSQGTVMMWVLLSTRAEYNAKINVATALAPICYLQYIQPPVGVLIRLSPVLYSVLRALGVTNLFGDRSVETLSIRAIAQIPLLGYLIVAYGFLFPIFGDDSPELGPGYLRRVVLQYPTGASVKNFEHYAQVALSNVFGRFDYGEAGNRVAYNASRPPAYRLRNVSTRVVLLAALNDRLAPIPDVEMLRQQLPNVIRYVIVPRLTMNHIDFTWGATAPIYLFRYIFDVLQNYSQRD